MDVEEQKRKLDELVPPLRDSFINVFNTVCLEPMAVRAASIALFSIICSLEKSLPADSSEYFSGTLEGMLELKKKHGIPETSTTNQDGILIKPNFGGGND